MKKNSRLMKLMLWAGLITLWMGLVVLCALPDAVWGMTWGIVWALLQ